jgi:hypothetical protein
MAASITKTLTVAGPEPYIVTRLTVGTLAADAIENLAHGGPSGAPARTVSMSILTRPISGDPVFMSHETASDSLTNNTVAVRFWTIPGGALTGAVVELDCLFGAVGSGGITAT